MYGFIWYLIVLVCHMEKSWNVRSLDLGRNWTDSRRTLLPKWVGAPSCCQTTRRRSLASLCYETADSVLGEEGTKRKRRPVNSFCPNCLPSLPLVEYLSLLWSPLGVFFTRISTSVSVCSSICLVCCFICPEHFPRKPRGKRREWSGTYRRIPSVCLDYHQHAVSEFGKPWLPESAAVRVRCHLTLPVLLKHVWRLARTVTSSLHYTVNCLLTWPISACHSVVILQHLQFLQLLHWLCILRAWVVVGGWWLDIWKFNSKWCRDNLLFVLERSDDADWVPTHRINTTDDETRANVITALPTVANDARENSHS